MENLLAYTNFTDYTSGFDGDHEGFGAEIGEERGEDFGDLLSIFPETQKMEQPEYGIRNEIDFFLNRGLQLGLACVNLWKFIHRSKWKLFIF